MSSINRSRGWDVGLLRLLGSVGVFLGGVHRAHQLPVPQQEFEDLPARFVSSGTEFVAVTEGLCSCFSRCVTQDPIRVAVEA
jgi:hypothetical protein